MALSENPTLKEVVDEVERLNNLIVDRGGSQTITPKTSDQTLYKGYYKGNITVKGDRNLSSYNILSGKSIFGISGNVVAAKKVEESDNLIHYYNQSSVSCEGFRVASDDFVEVQRIKAFFKGRVRIKTKARSEGTSGSMVVRFDLIRDGRIIKSSDWFTHNQTSFNDVSYDMWFIENGDDIVMVAKTGGSNYHGRVMPMIVCGTIS